jgi:hypothetical protein
MRLADQSDTTSDTRGDLGRFVAGRERQGRHRFYLPRDPEEASEVLAEQLGSRWAARGYLLAALEAAEAPPRYWRDHFGNKVVLP